MVAGAAYVPFGVRRIIPTVFSRSTPLRSLMIARDPHARYLTPPRLDDPLRAGVSKIWTGERVGRKEGRGRSFEDETIVWKSVSRYSRGDYYAARRGAREGRIY